MLAAVAYLCDKKLGEQGGHNIFKNSEKQKETNHLKQTTPWYDVLNLTHGKRVNRVTHV